MKKIISLSLSLIMVLTVCSFPAVINADDNAGESEEIYASDGDEVIEIEEIIDDETVSDSALEADEADITDSDNSEADETEENIDKSIKTEELNGVVFYLDTDGNLYINEISEENRICSEYTITNIFKIDDRLCAAVAEDDTDIIVINEDGSYSNYNEGIQLFTSNRDTIYNFLVGKGLNTAAACGVLANIKYESGYSPTALGDNGTSYGICQWHNSRYTSLKTYCSNNGYSYSSLTGQLYYLWYELNNDSYYTTKVLNYIKNVSNSATGAYNAAYDWCYYFEVPANKASVSKTRGNYAKNTIWPIYSPYIKPGKPTISSIQNKGTQTTFKLKVVWTAGSGGTPTSYEVWRKKGSGSYTKIKTTTSTAYTDTGLSASTKYSYKIVAKNSAGSATSAVKTAYTTPAAPTNVTVARNSSSPTSSLVISWDKVSSASSYIVVGRECTKSEYTTLGTTTGTSYTVKSLSAGTKYYYRVYAFKNDLKSAASDTVSKYTKLKAPTASSVGLKSATLSWSTATGPSGTNLAYTLYGKKATASSYSVYLKEGNNTAASSSSLSTGTQYICYVQVHNTSADTYPTSSQTVTFYTWMNAPTVSTVSGSTTKLKVSWTAVNGTANYRYKVYRRVSGNSSTTTLLTTTSGTSYTDSGLKAGTKYDYVIEVVTSSNTSTRLTKSNCATATTPTVATASLDDAEEVYADNSEGTTVILMEDDDLFDDIGKEDETTNVYSEESDDDEAIDDTEEDEAEGTDINCSIDAEFENDIKDDVDYEHPCIISNIKSDDSGITVTFTETSEQSSGIVVLAEYDDEGNMIQYMTADLSDCESGDDGIYTVYFETDMTNNIKAYILESLETMRPLSLTANAADFADDNTEDDSEEELSLPDSDGDEEADEEEEGIEA
ncbi:MAG: phage tail tip lysozyme [Clostridiales bacterium]|nr:phage tail tip lysozyme [Clostridiales bacterium]